MFYLNYLAVSLSSFSETVNSFLSNLGLEFHPEAVLGMLKHMGVGMLVIFVIIGIIILATIAIQKVFSSEKKVKTKK